MPDEEKTNTAAPVAPQRQIEYVTPPEGLTRFYANNIAMGSTKFDVRIIFGEIRDCGIADARYSAVTLRSQKSLVR